MPATPPPGAAFVVWLIVLVAVGFIMMVLFKLAAWWGSRPPIAPRVRSYPMSSRGAVPNSAQNKTEQRSYAAEQPTEQAGTGASEYVPAIVAHLERLSDDELLDILARVLDEDGDPRFAESKIGRFIGGRLEDRIAQVRDVRGIEVPAKPSQHVTPIVGRPTKAKYVGAE